MKEIAISPGSVQTLVRRLLEVLGALAIVTGLALLLVGVLRSDDQPEPDRLSPLFLERAKPAGDLLVVLEALRDGDSAIRLSALVQGPTRDDDPPQSVTVRLTDAASGQSRTISLEPTPTGALPVGAGGVAARLMVGRARNRALRRPNDN